MLFKLISLPDYYEGEITLLCRFFEAGLPCFHLRKPASTYEQFKHYLHRIPAKFHQKIMVHQFPELYDHFNLRGIHFNKMNPYSSEKKRKNGGVFSISAHSLNELMEIPEVIDYVFLSPVFDSISKKGYRSHFNDWELLKTTLTKFHYQFPGQKVIALGGVTIDKLEILKDTGFDGVGLIGGVWEFEHNKINHHQSFLNFKAFWDKVHGM